MSNHKPLPSVEYLRECFNYNPESGVLAWKVRPREHFKTMQAWSRWNTVFAGNRAGFIGRKGYRRICINAVKYKVSRVATKLMTGEDPPKTVDHRDTNPLNDKWENLRTATLQEQIWNRRLQRNNTSGFRGVYWTHYGWRARIERNSSQRTLGTYDTPEEAAAAYETEARRVHGEFYYEPRYAVRLNRRVRPEQ